MKKYYLLLFATIFLLSSCKKFLEQPAYNNVSVEEIFKDFEGARTTLVGLYDKLRSTNYYLLHFYTYPEVTGGNIKYAKPGGQILPNTYAFTRDEVAGNELKGFYQQAYAIIYGANNVLENSNKATDATVPQKDRMRAEAYAIRALVHFDLVRTFAQPYSFTADASHAGIVLKTRNTSVLTPTGEKASVKRVYDQITSDLDSAILLYVQSVSIYPTGEAKTFLSADAAKALKSRVSLYKDDWAAVISNCTELIASARYPLLSNSQYVASWRGRNISSESIFELAIPTTSGSGLATYYNPANTISYQFGTSNDLLNLYAIGDVRGTSSMFISKVTNGVTYYSTKKYQGMNDTINNIKIIRSSELYLNRAEAYAKSNNLTAALADLNVIRKRGLPSATTFTSTSQQVVADEILTERRRELAFEGHLFFDIARNKKDLVRTDNTAVIKSFTWPSALYAYPIPLYQ
jgi:hypothetical protein